jgi:thioredoxin 1
MHKNIYYPGIEFDIPKDALRGALHKSTEGKRNMPATVIDNFETFQSEVESAENEVLVQFKADWCMPCKAMASLVEEVSKAYPDVKVVTVDIEGDGMEPVLQKYEVRAVPTFVHVDKKGAPIKSLSGTISKAELRSLLEGK